MTLTPPGVSDQGPDGRAVDREAFVADQLDLDAEVQRAALLARRRQMVAKAEARVVAGAAPAGGPAAMDAPPADDDDLWVPLGPSTVLRGQADSRPRVAGRIRDLQVSPDGTRAYAGAANGGVWYTGDSGRNWIPVGGWAVTNDRTTVETPAHILATGAVLVNFGAGPASDEVLVGTGELTPITRGRPFSRNSGIGVLRAVGPAAAAAADPFGNPWNLEGTNLRAKGIYRLAVDPAAATTFVAATSSGLFTRTGGPSPAWTEVPAAGFGGAAGPLLVTDVAWIAATPAAPGPARPSRLFVAIGSAGATSGVWVSAAGTGGPFTQVALPGVGDQRRFTLAPGPPGVLYVLGAGNQVWRIDETTASPVTSVPPLRGQSTYNQAIAVDPTNANRIVVGGAAELVSNWNAALWAGVVTGAAPSYAFPFAAPAAPALASSHAAFIGNAIHSDVHVARFVNTGSGVHLWIGCDGGVFRSTQGGAANTFEACNDGLGVLEAGEVANHPSADGFLVAGLQDNGTIRRIGDAVWEVTNQGDGGGVVFDPINPNRYIDQYLRATWNGGSATGSFRVRPVLRKTGGTSTTSTNPANNATAAEVLENGNSEFYSACDAIRTGPASSRLALGTNRVWYSDDFGATWRTLPSLTDPMAFPGPPAQNTNTDLLLTTGGSPDPDGQVVSCRWATQDRLYVLSKRALFRFQFSTTAPLTVTRHEFSAVLPDKKAQPADRVRSPGQRLPHLGSWSEVHQHRPGQGAHGSVYVATTGDPDVDSMDTLWWFDGDDTWHATGLRSSLTGVPAPAYAIVVDNDAANDDTVYVGTSVGVWRGQLSFAGDVPSWSWEVFSNGLPEAPVQDLSLFKGGGMRLLRAAVQARGVWEVDLDAPGAAATFVRVHHLDSRRVAATLLDPSQPTATAPVRWHESPDLRVVPRRGTRPSRSLRPRTSTPWNGAAPSAHGLWVFQTALHANDPLVRPTGQWTPQFAARLTAATGANSITRATWNNVVGTASTPDAYADPWNDTEPGEADLQELIVDRPPSSATVSQRLPRARTRVHVMVHHRHLRAAPAATVRVTVIRKRVTGDDTAWAALSDDWMTPIQAFLRTGGAPPATLPGDWRFVDSTPMRSPTRAIDARRARPVSFNMDLRGQPRGHRWLLVAVVHSDADPVTLPVVDLGALVLQSRHVAVRSIEIR